jgi:hypothetical protein
MHGDGQVCATRGVSVLGPQSRDAKLGLALWCGRLRSFRRAARALGTGGAYLAGW